jgi:hypothetical protein
MAAPNFVYLQSSTAAGSQPIERLPQLCEKLRVFEFWRNELRTSQNEPTGEKRGFETVSRERSREKDPWTA